MTNEKQADPMDFLKTLWGNMGFSLPGMVTPTLDTDELAKRITDLKAVEGWLKSNLSLLQMTIHGLEIQCSTLSAMQQMSQSAQAHQAGSNSADSSTPNPFLNPAAWPMPWNLMSGAAAVTPAPTAEATPAPAAAPAASSQKGKAKR